MALAAIILEFALQSQIIMGGRIETVRALPADAICQT
jgi:hypothetical protein